MAQQRIGTAVVTGAGSGLGRALVLELCRRGAVVLAADVDEVGLVGTAREAAAGGGVVHTQRCDVTELSQVEALRDRAVELFSGVDCWVNNAGVAAVGEVGRAPIADWHWVIDVNMWGMIHGCHAIVPHMKARGRGHILNVSSAAGLLAPPTMGPYNVSKAAVVSLTQTLYAELKEHGVGATVLCPTFFQTNLMNTSRAPDPVMQHVAARLMARAKLTAGDVAVRALDDLLARRLYSVPMLDGRLAWTVLRLFPQAYFDLAPLVARAIKAGGRRSQQRAAAN
jgi:NAD(P)-dependent dehydrogenase (short-subunit alcohol dehydrogenase family)